jgi:hypothetical protein
MLFLCSPARLQETFNPALKVCIKTFSPTLKVCIESFSQTCNPPENLTENLQQTFNKLSVQFKNNEKTSFFKRKNNVLS